MGAKKKIFTIGKVLTYILLLLLAVGIIGFFARFTNGFTTDFKTFYVQYGEQKLLSNVTKFVMPLDKDVRFDVKYTMSFMSKDTPKEFKVKILPNITDETNFDFSVDGQAYSYSGETEFTSVFDIKQYDSYFTLNISKSTSMQDLIKLLYKDKQVETPALDLIANEYFSLFVFSHNEKSFIKIDFSFHSYVETIEIENGGIVL